MAPSQVISNNCLLALSSALFSSKLWLLIKFFFFLVWISADLIDRMALSRIINNNYLLAFYFIFVKNLINHRIFFFFLVYIDHLICVLICTIIGINNIQILYYVWTNCIQCEIMILYYIGLLNWLNFHNTKLFFFYSAHDAYAPNLFHIFYGWLVNSGWLLIVFFRLD